MIEQIYVKDEKYKDFELLDLTDNNIVFFITPQLKNEVVQLLSTIWEDHKTDGDLLDFYMGNDDEPDPQIDMSKPNVRYLPTTIVDLKGGQRFIFTIEAPFIFCAKTKEDIWFVDKDADDNIVCWAFTDFIGHENVWDKGIDYVYSEFCNGKYGCYHGYLD